MTITPEEIAEWRKVCEEASSTGPWFAEDGQDWRHDPRPAVLEFMQGDEGYILADFASMADARLAATARTAMPRLLDELAAKDALIAKYRGALERISKLGDYENYAVPEWKITADNALQASEES